MVGTDWRLVVVAPAAKVYAPGRQSRVAALWLLIALGIGSLMIAVLIVRLSDKSSEAARRATRPWRHLGTSRLSSPT